MKKFTTLFAHTVSQQKFIPIRKIWNLQLKFYQESLYHQALTSKMDVLSLMSGIKAAISLTHDDKLNNKKKLEIYWHAIWNGYEVKKVQTFIGASKDLATLTITGVKNTQNMSYTKSPACNWHKKICIS